MQEKPLAFLSLIQHLERVVGHKAPYTILEPFPCGGIHEGKPSIIAIQNAGRMIARHAGLAELTFVISVKEQQVDVAGHIDVNGEGNAVFVEVSPDICRYDEPLLSTICHEISHKYLHINGIRRGFTTIENEYLTDVTAVYLGMGKLMLNGCEGQYYQTTKSEESRLLTLKTGYISRD